METARGMTAESVTWLLDLLTRLEAQAQDFLNQTEDHQGIPTRHYAKGQISAWRQTAELIRMEAQS